ncbi:hypothetical protein QE152_g22969 [Popillia japonica]|uniref:Uncharacterized protein n=1 Tax=Popillia japonica TaxID=7064 RepID=A0AAW1KKD1_POPJA
MSTSRIEAVDTESDDTSGSPSGDCPTSSNYRVPVKHSRDMFRPDSSTESNEVSPLTERRNMPRQITVPRHHRTTSSSSSDRGEEGPSSGVCLEPPTGFSDGRSLNQIDSDRNVNVDKLTNELQLATYIAGYRDKRKEERKEFTIHV